ncbi:Hypothetical predicted protein [Lecanosticta acicola]|uniref:DUF7730 domain-containing protein n=1 Tax=Lecanosticta acicola TaxID=111012 RepID=A0AAI8YZY6_9PEZI|nr:Hypothetical predicted protein [Lecanosticta acicola]
MNEDLLLFRLPTELRIQIYDYIFFSHIRDPPILDSNWLQRPATYKRCMRLWIEGEDLLAHRNWLNDFHAEPLLSDSHAVLRTCRRIYADAGAYLYDNTLFMLFTSTKYSRLVQKHGSSDSPRLRPRSPSEVPSPLPLMAPGTVSVYSRKYDHLDPNRVPRWKKTRYCWVFQEPPRVTFLGRLGDPESFFLRHARHVRIDASVKTPSILALVMRQLQNVASVLPQDLGAMEARLHIQLDGPKQRSLEPRIPWTSRQNFLKMVRLFEGNFGISIFATFWLVAFGRPFLYTLLDLRGERCSVYPNIKKGLYHHQLEELRRLLDKWEISWCGECEDCLAREAKRLVVCKDESEVGIQIQDPELDRILGMYRQLIID